MTTYNPNDFYPRSGAEIDSSGNVKNDADGLNSDGSRNSKLVGRNATEIMGHNGITITDTTNHDTSMLDISGISGRKYIHVYNSLNQSVNITPIFYDYSGTISFAGAVQSIGAGVTMMITATQIPQLLEPVQKIKIRASCATPPTSGTLTSLIEGVQA